MDNKVAVDQLGVAGNVTFKSIDKLDEHLADMEADNCLNLSLSPSVDKDRISLRPITPESNKESSELMSCFQSPLTSVSSPPTTVFCLNDTDDDIGSPSTPKATVFDPFAPGPDSLLLAPRSMKHLQESRSYVERRLNFNSIMTKNDRVSEKDDDDMLLEAVYDSLLECIISKQAEDILGEISAVDSSSHDAFVTPPFAPRLTGIADTCPDAPLKPVKKSRYIDLSLCRKLDFGF